MKKLLVITPHLSTGGAPQVTANKVKLMKNDFDVMVVEYAFIAWAFVVQRNRIISTVGEDKFKSLGENKLQELQNIFESFSPDVVSMEEFPELFMGRDVSDWLYRNDRNYTIIETSHESSFNPATKSHFPDKFVFVSPFHALKFNHLDIPIEMIEYPVDEKKQEKAFFRKKLGLEADYKHIVIIGLFTPRKNQKYAFELCDKLHEYKIKFHFLGNQAGNFDHYWRPLMDWKASNPNLNNCVVWGERSDTDDFMNAADLFLFCSKGDRGNKELNPIVIKESLEYPDLPKLMYNLDVYLNRYDGIKNMNYLTGDFAEDANKILELTKPNTYVNKEELIILGTYPNLQSRVQLTKDTIKSLKPLGRKIMLVSHYPVDEDIQRMVDYYIFDSENPLCHHSYYTKFYRHTNEYHVDMNINGLKQSNQSLTVLTNMFNAAKAAKYHGYSKFFYTTYDVVLHEDDISIVDTSFRQLYQFKAYLGSLNTPFGKGIQTNGMAFNTDFFLELFDDVRDADSFNDACQKAGCHNFLEDYMMKKILQRASEVQLINNDEETLLINSGLGVASNSEYYSILPIDKEQGHYMFYFFTYNVDERKVSVIMKEDGAEFYNGRFQISKSREFKKDIFYTGKTIDITLEFHDGDNTYKTEVYSLNNLNISNYNHTGLFKWINKKPKIKLVHIQTTINDEREQRSRESLQRVSEYGIEYILHTNKPYEDLPPKYNCLRPQCVSMELFDDNTVRELGTALTPPHYGCYEAFKYAILSEFNECDFILVCEGDCLIEKPIDEFCNAVYEAANLMDDNKIGFFSFGDSVTLEHGWPQSPVVEEIPNQNLAYITNHIIGIQSIMFSKPTKNWLKDQFRTNRWDAADIWFNTVFRTSPYKMGIVKSRLTTQADGYSLIDKQEKKFL